MLHRPLSSLRPSWFKTILSLPLHPFSLNSSLSSMATPRSQPPSTAAPLSPIEPGRTRIGWIGTGIMGASMCTRILAAGFSVTVFNRTAAKAQPLVALGANYGQSPADVAAASDVLFTMLALPSDVRSALLDTALPNLPQNSVSVDMTTSEPALALEIASFAAARGCVALDCPVSGGDTGARNGTLAIFAGGDETQIHRLGPLFKCLGTVHYMGGPGLGQQAKLGNQVAIASTMVGMVESLIYAHKAGLHLGTFVRAIAGGAAGSRSLELHGSRVLRRDMEPGFIVEHFVKDLGIALRECERMAVSLPGLALAQQLYVSLKANGEGRLGTQALVLALERVNNTRLSGP
ncbi:probable 3-hydroxyisobutyrate dehydrogenase-like 1, mitochondrial [Amborella trichopoda]|nr:probable 3-hydroxyisobutyrate dehydrogenase-like 1, mitochondrial [Amborella trichopoda]|eukprot:XP_006853689.2 probable 3-hydroxyisobutyrate dehydrogenase-like 1, mitochondrial [Amborella trichopoda]